MKATTENIDERIAEIFDNSKTVEEFYFELYMIWCESVSINDREFQQVLASTCVSNWFKMEFSKHVKEYNLLIRTYPHATDEDCFAFYTGYIKKLFSISPKVLLKEAKKLENRSTGNRLQKTNHQFKLLILNQN